MFRFIFALILSLHSYCVFSQEAVAWKKLLSSKELELSRADLIVYDHFLQIYKVADKGYASNYLLDKGLQESIMSLS